MRIIIGINYRFPLLFKVTLFEKKKKEKRGDDIGTISTSTIARFRNAHNVLEYFLKRPDKQLANKRSQTYVGNENMTFYMYIEQNSHVITKCY